MAGSPAEHTNSIALITIASATTEIKLKIVIGDSIIILILGSFDAFSQKRENHIKEDTMQVSEYKDYGIKVYFEGSIDIIKNNVDEERRYFYNSIEIYVLMKIIKKYNSQA